MLDKSIRVENMVSELGALLGLSKDSIAIAHQAAPLATADLATSVVTEFTSLAGIMGKHYALREGQPIMVSKHSPRVLISAASAQCFLVVMVRPCLLCRLQILSLRVYFHAMQGIFSLLQIPEYCWLLLIGMILWLPFEFP
jgi:predicted regulator of Ras-like GTPase activity (Roadblock/LC7/MglB family)